jgi:hypothetical protein
VIGRVVLGLVAAPATDLARRLHSDTMVRLIAALLVSTVRPARASAPPAAGSASSPTRRRPTSGGFGWSWAVTGNLRLLVGMLRANQP